MGTIITDMSWDEAQKKVRKYVKDEGLELGRLTLRDLSIYNKDGLVAFAYLSPYRKKDGTECARINYEECESAEKLLAELGVKI